MSEPRVVWYHDGGSRFPAKTLRFHTPTSVDLGIAMFGSYVRRQAVTLVPAGGLAPEPYAEIPDVNEELPDLSVVEEAERAQAQVPQMPTKEGDEDEE